MREIKHGEKFIATKELYSGDYIIQIAKKRLFLIDFNGKNGIFSSIFTFRTFDHIFSLCSNLITSCKSFSIKIEWIL